MHFCVCVRACVRNSDHTSFFLEQGPLKIQPLKWVLGLLSLADAFAWDGDQRDAIIHIVPRDPSKGVKVKGR